MKEVSAAPSHLLVVCKKTCKCKLTFFLIWSKNPRLLKSDAWNSARSLQSQSCVCVCVCLYVPACSETWGWAGSLLPSRHTAVVSWRGGEAAYRLSHCVTHWRCLRLFHKLPRINLFVRRKWALCNLQGIFLLGICQGYLEMLFGKVKTRW